jgi:uncharacterized protein YdeI (YjbR/CyaY-like superfamily)
MSSPDPRIDDYIDKAAEFARPILQELRARVHAACPEAHETIKWGAPTFTYRDKQLALMAAFKHHVAFNLPHGSAVVDAGDAENDAMGQFGRITSIADLPDTRAFAKYVCAAMKLIEQGVPARAAKPAKPPPVAPSDLLEALAGNDAARRTFEGFPPGKQRDYIDWLTDASREETRRRRLAQAIEWLAEGKARNWKYQSC